MLNHIVCAVTAAVILLAAGPVRATAIDFTAEAAGVLLPAHPTGKVLDFDTLPIGALPSYPFDGGALSGPGAVENTSIIGMSARPAGDTTGYLTVSYPSAVGAARLAFSSPENYFGLYWGSMDSWNSITFLNHGTPVAAYSGTDVAGLTGLVANGDQQSASSNRYINFNFGDAFYDEVVLATTAYGFEIDNLSFGDPPTPVPEPSALMVLALSICGLLLVRNHRFDSSRGEPSTA